MKRIFVIILLLTLLVGCGKQISENSSVAELPGNVVSIIPNTSQAEQGLGVPSEYEEILAQYQVIVNSWSSDNDEEGYPNFTKDFENNKLPYPNGSEEYEWSEMLIDGKYPKHSKYGYILKDINEDNVPEMFWVNGEYTLLAAFTIVDGNAITIGAYRPKNSAIVLDSGEIYEYRSGGANVYELSLLELQPESYRFTVVKRVGRFRDEYFYEINNGEEIAISNAEFERFVRQYPFPLQPTEAWKSNTTHWVKTQGDG